MSRSKTKVKLLKKRKKLKQKEEGVVIEVIEEGREVITTTEVDTEETIMQRWIMRASLK